VAPGSELYADDRLVVVATSRHHRDRWLIRFEGVDDRSGAEQLRGAVLTGEPLERPDDDHRLWVGDVIGAEVRDRTGKVLGNVVAIETNPAHDLIVLDDGTLVPAVFVVDHTDGLVVDLPAGLLDVNPRAE
jgi:16S rRNA processing protein RimM